MDRVCNLSEEIFGRYRSDLRQVEQKQMTQDSLSVAVDRVRSLTMQDTDDPRRLVDELQRVIDRLEAAQRHVPADLRQNAADLEAEIVDEFFDNLPV